jgi:hypothetical protein
MAPKSKAFKSAYSELYLVTPNVYKKLLSCITKSETDDTEKLNGEFQTDDVLDTKISEMAPEPAEPIEMATEQAPTEKVAKIFEEDDDTLALILQRIDKMQEMQEQLYAKTNTTPNNEAPTTTPIEPVTQQQRPVRRKKEPQQQQQIPPPLKLTKKKSPEFNDNVATKQKIAKIDSLKARSSKHQCEICSKTFTRAYSKMRHKATVHAKSQAYTATPKNIIPTPTQLKNEQRGTKRRKEIIMDPKKRYKEDPYADITEYDDWTNN